MVEIRKSMPRLGTKVILSFIGQTQLMKIGRDKFFDILRANHLLISQNALIT
jgi:phage antirepressor YoqD-like protein